KNADDAEADALKTELLPDRRASLEELAHNCFSDEAHPRGVADFDRGEHLPFREVAPVADFEVRRRAAVDGLRHPVAVLKDGRRACTHDWRSGRNSGALAEDRLAVLRRERERAAGAEGNAAARRRPRH